MTHHHIQGVASNSRSWCTWEVYISIQKTCQSALLGRFGVSLIAHISIWRISLASMVRIDTSPVPRPPINPPSLGTRLNIYQNIACACSNWSHGFDRTQKEFYFASNFLWCYFWFQKYSQWSWITVEWQQCTQVYKVKHHITLYTWWKDNNWWIGIWK